ncbi:MAG: hypothetical protein V3V85_03090 [Candidatus Thorarchaeota archaeon]
MKRQYDLNTDQWELGFKDGKHVFWLLMPDEDYIFWGNYLKWAYEELCEVVADTVPSYFEIDTRRVLNG